MPLPSLDTRHLFFTGKGGVGKTSLSCACALALAAAGQRVLLVSTDPASNLDEVLGTALGDTPTEVTGADGLWALNLDPTAAAADYRERMVGPYRGILPAAAIASMEEQFSGACTVEIAAFDAFSRLLGDADATAGFDRVIFDTAPTGHTLRLLTLPSAWDAFIESSTGGASCLGPLAGLERQKALYAASVARLADPSETTLVLVARPEAAALREAARTCDELAALGVRNQRLAINGVFDAPAPDDAVAVAFAQRGQAALADMPVALTGLPRSTTGYLPKGTTGLDALRSLAADAAPYHPAGACTPPALPGLGSLTDALARQGHGVVMTLGKGGVGKTTVAAAIAVDLARRGLPVTLTTTDPAAHVAASVAEGVAGLEVERIDPAAEVAAYRASVLARVGEAFDARGRAMLEEDLRSPCTEEIAVFHAFARTVAAGQNRIVVVDTAPTGHTILLLDAAEAYHREVLRSRGELPDAVRTLLPRLRDQDFTRMLIVTLAEATPVHEAAALQADLRRAGIEPWAWLINQSLAASGTADPCLAARGIHELRWIDEVTTRHAGRTALTPWTAGPLEGPAGLSTLTPSQEDGPATRRT
ncbi:MAG: arsenical pump-driving ATPase [Rhodocyclaceae bacterium]|nr:arsenical pump-driving ATPase [Rhodocyclaceae bacterium]